MPERKTRSAVERTGKCFIYFSTKIMFMERLFFFFFKDVSFLLMLPQMKGITAYHETPTSGQSPGYLNFCCTLFKLGTFR